VRAYSLSGLAGRSKGNAIRVLHALADAVVSSGSALSGRFTESENSFHGWDFWLDFRPATNEVLSAGRLASIGHAREALAAFLELDIKPDSRDFEDVVSLFGWEYRILLERISAIDMLYLVRRQEIARSEAG
jgi:hypothetical protein